VDRPREPLSFARAANRGIARERYPRVCLLNNDMLLDRGFFEALARAFDQVSGCWLYDTARLRLLGRPDSTYEPAYVEDLESDSAPGFAAGRRFTWRALGSSTATAPTTSRDYTSQQLDAILALNYLKFLARAVSSFPPPVGASSRPSPPSVTSRYDCRPSGTLRSVGDWQAADGGREPLFEPSLNRLRRARGEHDLVLARLLKSLNRDRMNCWASRAGSC
jgi:hypothetical protein